MASILPQPHSVISLSASGILCYCQVDAWGSPLWHHSATSAYYLVTMLPAFELAPWVQWVLPSSNFCPCCCFTCSGFSSLCLADSIHSNLGFLVLISVGAYLFPSWHLFKFAIVYSLTHLAFFIDSKIYISPHISEIGAHLTLDTLIAFWMVNKIMAYLTINCN